ncbi:hypothetical protein Csa_023678, partial [Cucumis sativus]
VGKGLFEGSRGRESLYLILGRRKLSLAIDYFQVLENNRGLLHKSGCGDLWLSFRGEGVDSTRVIASKSRFFVSTWDFRVIEGQRKQEFRGGSVAALDVPPFFENKGDNPSLVSWCGGRAVKMCIHWSPTGLKEVSFRAEVKEDGFILVGCIVNHWDFFFLSVLGSEKEGERTSREDFDSVECDGLVDKKAHRGFEKGKVKPIDFVELGGGKDM